MFHDLVLYTPMYITVFWAIILLLKPVKENRAKFMLGVFMFVTFLLFASHSVYYNHLTEVYLYFDLLFVFASLSVYPLYYWYVKLLTDETELRWINLRHFIPALTLLIGYFIFSTAYILNNRVATLLNHSKIS